MRGQAVVGGQSESTAHQSQGNSAAKLHCGRERKTDWGFEKKKEGSKPKERKVLGEGESKESLPASGRKKSTPGGHSAGDHDRFIYERTLGYSTRP